MEKSAFNYDDPLPQKREEKKKCHEYFHFYLYANIIPTLQYIGH